MHLTYPDVLYKVATAAILIQTRGVQSVFSLEKSLTDADIRSSALLIQQGNPKVDKQILL